ncbi:MAG: hypothetical protein PUF50_08375 [Erysipelotrichaceae bacterium]|nr:hypothetical protein [Erysipelotrichaceae bacterium]
MKRIISHLNMYGNTIIVPSDFKNDCIENLIKKIEDAGFKITSLERGYDSDDASSEYWVIDVN